MLSVIIGGDASALDKMLKGAESSVGSFAKRISAIAGGVGLEKAIEGAASALVSTIQKGLADAQELSKMSESTGFSIEQMSRLKYAADIAGVSTDQLKASLQTLSGGISDLAAGAVTSASDALRAMGIAAKNSDGSIKSSGQVLSEVADKFATYRDGANKAKLAQDLFGAGGEGMISLLNKGSAGLAELGDEASRYGLVLDNQTKQAVLSFNTSLAKMDAIKNGLVTTIVAKLAPALSSIASAMLAVREKSNLVSTVADLIGEKMKYLAAAGLTVVTVFDRVTGSFSDLFKAAGFLIKGDFNGAWDTLASSANKTVDSAKALKTAIDGLFDPLKTGAAETGKEIAEKVEAPLAGVRDTARDALSLFLDTQAKRTAGTLAEANTVGLASDAQARLKVEYEAAAIAQAKGITLTEEYRQRIQAAGEAAANAARALAGANLTQQSLMPWQQRNQLLRQYVDLLNAGNISMETFSVASMKVQFPNFSAAAIQAMDLQMQLDQLSTCLVNGVASAFAQVVTGQKSASEAFQQFALQFITMIVEMIAKALIFKAVMMLIGFSDGGPVGSGTGFSLTSTGGLYDAGGYTGPGGKYEPAGIVHKGEVVFSQADVARWGGVANVETLRRAAMPTFADGGAPGISSLPGTSVPQVPYGGPPQVVELRGLDRRSFLTRDMLADLIESLNGMHRNGYKLKLA